MLADKDVKMATEFMLKIVSRCFIRGCTTQWTKEQWNDLHALYLTDQVHFQVVRRGSRSKLCDIMFKFKIYSLFLSIALSNWQLTSTVCDCQFDVPLLQWPSRLQKPGIVCVGRECENSPLKLLQFDVTIRETTGEMCRKVQKGDHEPMIIPSERILGSLYNQWSIISNFCLSCP